MMEHYVKGMFLGKLIGGSLQARFERLLVNQDPKAVLAILYKFRELDQDENATDARNNVHGARLLHLPGMRKDVEDFWRV